MLTAIVLVCSLTATPDLQDCNRQTAVSVMRVPQEVSMPGTCLKLGSAYLANTQMGRDLTDDERVKVVCVPTEKLNHDFRQQAMLPRK